VPSADVLVSVPGASSEEVERLVATPLERYLWQIDGVEHVYSISRRDGAVVTVRFFVGEDREQAQARHSAARAALAQAESGVRAAAAQLAQAAAALETAGIALGRTRIQAPFAGVLSERTVEPGEIVTPGRALLVLVDPAQLRVLAVAREDLAGALVPGARLEVEVPAAGVTLAGTVEELAPRVDERSRSLELRLLLDAPPGCLPGMFARVRLARPEREVVLVPARALARVGQLATLRVRESEGWGRRYVSVGGAQPDGRVEILAGLAGGELVGWDG